MSLLLELRVAWSAFLGLKCGQCGCLKASRLGRHEATRGRSTMSLRLSDLVREGLGREYLLGFLILGIGANEMVPLIPVSQ